jgi:arylsulfatase A-like enzyme
MESRSLRRLLTGKTNAVREYVHSGMDRWRLVMEGQYKYVRGWGDGPMLFDLGDDPAENTNLASDKPEVAAKLERLFDR